jgi:hypothetical protein
MHRHRFLGSPLRRVAVAAAIAAAAVSLASTVVPAPTAGAQTTPSGWYIDANSLYVRNADEDSWYSNGDEPMFAVVAFRTTLGVRGSTDAWPVSGFDELCTHADEGDTCSIPDSTGRAYFGHVSTPTAAEMLAGARPELIGTIQVAVEHDGTSMGTMNSILGRLVDATRAELAAASEGLTPADMADLGSVASRFSSISSRIQDRIELSWWDKLTTWIGSGGDTDKLVGYKVTVMVGVDRSLQQQVDMQLYAALEDSGMAVAVLSPRDVTFDHRASGIRYEVAERIFYMPGRLGP